MSFYDAWHEYSPTSVDNSRVISYLEVFSDFLNQRAFDQNVLGHSQCLSFTIKDIDVLKQCLTNDLLTLCKRGPCKGYQYS